MYLTDLDSALLLWIWWRLSWLKHNRGGCCQSRAIKGPGIGGMRLMLPVNLRSWHTLLRQQDNNSWDPHFGLLELLSTVSHFNILSVINDDVAVQRGSCKP